MSKPQPGREIQLPYLETFSHAAELCSFTAAGHALGMTQAAVSQRIHALEVILGKPLFERNGTRIHLTQAGQQLYGYAQRILGLHQEALECITGLKASVSGELLLAASSVPGEQLLPDVLSAFRKQHPHVQTKATIVDSLAAIHEIEHGHVHLALVGCKPSSRNLEVRLFSSDELVIAVPADHPWRRRRAVSLKQLARQPLVVRASGSGSRSCFEQSLATCGKSLNDFDVALELGSNEAVKKAVVAGMGAAVISSLAIRHEVAMGAMHPLRVSDMCLKRSIYVVLDSRKALPAAARTFLSFLESSQPVS